VKIAQILVAVFALHYSGQSYAEETGRFKRRILDLPPEAKVEIGVVGRYIDGGSVGVELRFSNGGKLILCAINRNWSGDEKLEQSFEIFEENQWKAREIVQPNGEVEKRLVELLKNLKARSSDKHQVKNTSTLIELISDRKKPWPGREAWHFNDGFTSNKEK